MEIDLNGLLKQAEEGYLIKVRHGGKLNIFARSSSGDTLLHAAVGRSNLSEIVYLLDNGLDIDSQGDYMETPLHVAAIGGIR